MKPCASVAPLSSRLLPSPNLQSPAKASAPRASSQITSQAPGARLQHFRQFAFLLLVAAPACAQSSAPQQGTVLIQSHGEAPTPSNDPTQPAQPQTPANPPTSPTLTDADRSAVSITAYDLDARLTPATSRLAMRARLTLRNAGPAPLSQIALQISSSLHWESATLFDGPRRIPLTVAQHLLDTDADHTGKSSEAILTLPQPLTPGASLTIDTFYSGAIAKDAGRLTRIGASSAQAEESDWDEIAANDTALRGFGNVLWYPVTGPQLFLGEGAELFQAIGSAKLENESVSVHLRLGVEYRGEPPAAVYFCGRRQLLKPISDDPDAPMVAGSGLATAEFPAQPIGFRVLNLFLFNAPETLTAPLPSLLASSSSSTAASTSSSSSSSQPASNAAEAAPSGLPMLAVETTDEGVLPRISASAETVAPLLEHWFGAPPLSALTLLDHSGQPFEDGPFVVAPLAALSASDAAPALAHSMTHAWIQSGQPWMDEGLAEFASLLFVEQEQGRAAAVAHLNDLLHPLVLAEPAPANSKTAPPAPLGEPLIAATDEIYYRRKAAAAWWMLRGIVGDDALRETLAAWRIQPPSSESPHQQAVSFEQLLEKATSPRTNLQWFFNDWVLNDRGLPDLSITDVTPRELSADIRHQTGWLVAVTVRNDGAAAAEVPVVIRSGTFSTTKRLLIPGFGQATDRVLVEAPPTQVVVNDGTTPEMRTSLHVRDIVAQPAH
jgi:hypothetical protein